MTKDIILAFFFNPGELQAFRRRTLFDAYLKNLRSDPFRLSYENAGELHTLLLITADIDELCDEFAADIRRCNPPKPVDYTNSAGVVSAICYQMKRANQVVSAPAIAKRRLHVAVCVSGQLRGFRQAHPSWVRLGLDGHKVTYVIHTWKKKSEEHSTRKRKVRRDYSVASC